ACPVPGGPAHGLRPMAEGQSGLPEGSGGLRQTMALPGKRQCGADRARAGGEVRRIHHRAILLRAARDRAALGHGPHFRAARVFAGLTYGYRPRTSRACRMREQATMKAAVRKETLCSRAMWAMAA